MRGLWQEVGCFCRSVRTSPGFFFAAVLTLALGIGANIAIFSAVNAVLLRPLPFDEPDRLVRLFETEAAPGNSVFPVSESAPARAGSDKRAFSAPGVEPSGRR